MKCRLSLLSLLLEVCGAPTATNGRMMNGVEDDEASEKSEQSERQSVLIFLLAATAGQPS